MCQKFIRHYTTFTALHLTLSANKNLLADNVTEIIAYVFVARM